MKMSNPIRRCILPVIALLLLAVSVEPSSRDLSRQIDSFLTASTRKDEPGLTVVVMKNGKTILKKGYGMADLELGVSIEPDMVFRIGSMTKQFTAVAVLQLAETGKLSPDDNIQKYLPDYDTQGKNIRIENLLTHTSGITSYTNMPEWHSLWRKDMSVEELIRMFEKKPLRFEPGENWEYCNSGYILLGRIIEKVSGETYESYLEKHIFQPLEMKNTYYGNAARIIPKRVHGYSVGSSGYENAPYLSMSQPFAAGALLSNVEDLATWDSSLYTEKLLKLDSLAKAWTGYTLKNGTPTGYGYGWGVGTYEGHKVILHDGGINGFVSSGVRFPEQKVYVAILSNNEAINANALAIRVAALAIGKPVPEPVVIRLPSEKLDRYVGVYQLDENSQRIIRKEGDRLISQRTGGEKYELLPISETEFFIKGFEGRFHFTENNDGSIATMERRGIIDYGFREVARKTDLPLPENQK